VTDSVSDYLFVTEQSGIDNLLREGHASEQMFLVGNVMVDTLLSQMGRATARAAWQRFGLGHRRYGVVTLHRPSNVDDPARLDAVIGALQSAAGDLPLVFPVHPRTRARLDAIGRGNPGGLVTCDPLPYVDFLSLLCGARAVITDSGGIQEETTMLGVPCLTLRDNTERPVTITRGTNRLIGTDVTAVAGELAAVLASPMPRVPPPPFWDGAAATRIVEVLERAFVADAHPACAASPV
jgi:UDP-N-acetylglucosamine 2-epimerase (non-hydrolysing)